MFELGSVSAVSTASCTISVLYPMAAAEVLSVGLSTFNTESDSHTCSFFSSEASIEVSTHCLQLRANGDKDIDDIRTLMEEVDMRIAGERYTSDLATSGWQNVMLEDSCSYSMRRALLL